MLRKRVPEHVLAAREHAPAPVGIEEAIARAGLQRELSIFLPEDYPIPEATEFNPAGSVSTVAVETGTAIPLAPSVGADAGFITLPANCVGRIAGVIFSITNMLTTTNVTFTLTINGGPVAGYNNITITPRITSFVDAEFSAPGCRVLVPNGAKIGVKFSNADGGSYVVAAAVSGWFWPKQAGDRWNRLGY